MATIDRLTTWLGWREEGVNAAKNAQARMEKLQQGATAVAGSFTIAGGALTAATALTVREAARWESSFTGVRKTVDATDAELLKLEDDLRNMALLDVPIDVHELAAIGEAAGQLGIATENITEFSRVMAMLGVTTNLTSEDAATMIARFANVSGLDPSMYEAFGSVIVELGNNMATTEAEIMSMAMRLVGAGSQIGLTEASILGISAALTSVGIKAEMGGTAFSRIMLEIDKAVGTGAEEMATFAEVSGMSKEAFAEAWGSDVEGTIVSFITGLGQVIEGGADVEELFREMNVHEVLEELDLDAMRVGDTLRRAAQAGDLMPEAMERARIEMASNTALAAEASLRFGTLDSLFQFLKSHVKELGISWGEHLMPMIREAVSALNPLLRQINEWIQANPELVQWLSTLGPIILGVGGAFGILAAMMAAATVAGGPITAIALAAVALGAAVSGIGLAIRQHRQETEAATVEVEGATQRLADAADRANRAELALGDAMRRDEAENSAASAAALEAERRRLSTATYDLQLAEEDLATAQSVTADLADTTAGRMETAWGGVEERMAGVSGAWRELMDSFSELTIGDGEGGLDIVSASVAALMGGFEALLMPVEAVLAKLTQVNEALMLGSEWTWDKDARELAQTLRDRGFTVTESHQFIRENPEVAEQLAAGAITEDRLVTEETESAEAAAIRGELAELLGTETLDELASQVEEDVKEGAKAYRTAMTISGTAASVLAAFLPSLGEDFMEVAKSGALKLTDAGTAKVLEYLEELKAVIPEGMTPIEYLQAIAAGDTGSGVPTLDEVIAAARAGEVSPVGREEPADTDGGDTEVLAETVVVPADTVVMEPAETGSEWETDTSGEGIGTVKRGALGQLFGGARRDAKDEARAALEESEGVDRESLSRRDRRAFDRRADDLLAAAQEQGLTVDALLAALVPSQEDLLAETETFVDPKQMFRPAGTPISAARDREYSPSEPDEGILAEPDVVPGIPAWVDPLSDIYAGQGFSEILAPEIDVPDVGELDVPDLGEVGIPDLGEVGVESPFDIYDDQGPGFPEIGPEILPPAPGPTSSFQTTSDSHDAALTISAPIYVQGGSGSDGQQIGRDIANQIELLRRRYVTRERA